MGGIYVSETSRDYQGYDLVKAPDNIIYLSGEVFIGKYFPVRHWMFLKFHLIALLLINFILMIMYFCYQMNIL